MNSIDPEGLKTVPFAGEMSTEFFSPFYGPNGPTTPYTPPKVPSGKPGLGMEIHYGVEGGGIDTFYCCDKNFKRWRVRTKKTCRGYAMAVSSGIHTTKLNTSDCPNGYQGTVCEIGAGPIEVTIPQTGTNGSAIGISAGAGFKITTCTYTIIEKEIIGCCR